MTNEELILERLESIESQLAPLAQSAKSMSELKDDLTFTALPVTERLVQELADVEASFQLEDLTELMKQMLRSVRNITWSLGQLENLIDFVTTLEPLLKTSVPQLINYLDDLEQRGVFRIIQATLDFRSKVAATYTAEDIDQIGDGLVALLNLARKISDPQATAFLEKIAEVPAEVDLEAAKSVGPFGFLWVSSSKEVKEGLGVMIELTKAMGKLKS